MGVTRGGGEVSPTIVVHAGAGSWAAERVPAAVAACERAVAAGTAVLSRGGPALEAVLAAVRVLEDDPACNAGTGAVLTSDGTLELDACIVDGATRRSGAVGALPPFLHPIDVARAVMDDGRFTLLVADGATRFALEHGFEPAAPEAMIVRRPAPDGNTVGAAALDGHGRLAAATSTGGIAGQAPGRIGDTPIVGASTFADDRIACSWTGQGEAISRALGAFVTSLHADQGAQGAATTSLRRVADEFGGVAGLVAVDRLGGVGIAHNARAMPHGIGRAGEAPSTGA